MRIQITHLNDYREYVAALAHWAFESCKDYIDKPTIKGQIEKFKKHCNVNKLPLALIALDERQQLIGMCSLRESDGLSSDLTPWLGSLYVTPSQRRQKVGYRLIEEIKQIAKNIACTDLYTWAPENSIDNYYIKLGWTIIGKDTLNKLPISIMQIKLI